MKAVADSSVLIFFSKMGRLGLLCELFKVIASRAVVAEVLAGKESHPEGMGNFESFISGRRIKVFPGGGHALGEDATIALATSKKIPVVLMDDYVGCRKARLHGLKIYGCPFILLLALQKKIISKAEFDGLLDLLLSFNYFISPALLRKITAAAEKLS